MQILKAMIGRFSILRGGALAIFFAVSLFAQDETESTSPAEADLLALLGQVNAKMEGGRPPADIAASFADEIARFTELRAKYAGDKSEDVAAISYLQASFYAQILGDADTGLELLRELAEEFPGTQAAEVASNAIASLEQKAQAEERLAHLVGSPAPELDFTWVNDGETAKLSELQGKVVVLDFWATWCGPCVRSFPHVKELTEHYAGSEVEIIGVTSLQGQVHGLDTAPIDVRNDPAKEYALMNDYIAKMGINWTIAFSEQEVFNPDYGITGIPHMAIIAPDGTIRHRGLHPAMPHEEKLAMIDAILEEFALPVPGA